MPVLFWLDVVALWLSATLSLSLTLVVIGSGPRQPLNRAFALFTVVGAAWALSSALLRLSLWLERGNPLLLGELAALCMVLMGPLLLRFTTRYLGLSDRRAELAAAAGLAAVVLLAVPLFQHRFLADPRLTSNGSTVMDLNRWGLLAASLPTFYLVWPLALFWRERRRLGEPYLAASIGVLVGGFLVGGVLEIPYPVLSFTNTVSVAILGWGVIGRQLFNPLRQRTAQLHTEVAERRRAEDLMRGQRDLGIALGAVRSLDDALDLCLEAAISLSGMDAGGIYLVDESSGDLHLAAHSGVSPEFAAVTARFEAGSDSAQLVTAGTPIYTRHEALQTQPEAARMAEGLKALAVIPASYEGRVVACLNVASTSQPEVPSYARNTLEAIASQIAGSVVRARAEQALFESERRYRLLAENVRDTIILLDMNLRVTYVSPSVENLGYSVEEALSLSPQEFLTPASFELAAGTLSEELELERTVGPRPPVASRTLEVEVRRKDSSTLWAEVRLGFLRDDKGAVVGALGVARDITDRRLAEEERAQLLSRIQQQAQHVRQIMDTVPDGVLVLDVDGRVLLANPEAERLLAVLAGAKTGDVLRRLGDRLLEELLAPPPSGLWHEVMAEKGTFEVVARKMENGHGPGTWVLLAREVTQEREVQQRTERRDRLAAIGQLAAGIAHDFNNIMAVIVLYTQMGLRLPDLSPRLRERLETIAQQAKRATDLTQQILDFARRAVLERRPMDLVPFLKEQVDLLERTLPESIRLEMRYGGAEYIVNADPTRMQQAIVNLAVNARDAMPGGGTLKIELDRIRLASAAQAPMAEMDPGEWVRLIITDSGMGIPANVLPRLFEPFLTTKEVGKGTGLGLAQVYGIVKQHQGQIDVVSHAQQGTSFVIYLPALSVAAVQEPPPESTRLVQGSGQTILVVEDDAAMREALVESMDLLNYRTLAVKNGREALAALEENPAVALVLSDLVMPEIGGRALFQEIRRRGWKTPVVMLSGHPLENELKDLQDQGLSGWILKPPRLEQLARLLAQVLGGPEPG